MDTERKQYDSKPSKRVHIDSSLKTHTRLYATHSTALHNTAHQTHTTADANRRWRIHTYMHTQRNTHGAAFRAANVYNLLRSHGKPVTCECRAYVCLCVFACVSFFLPLFALKYSVYCFQTHISSASLPLRPPLLSARID